MEISHTLHGRFSDAYLFEMMNQVNEPRKILESEYLVDCSRDCNAVLASRDQMTFMIESSRAFLFTEYARSGCGTFKNQGSDPKVWDALSVSATIFSTRCHGGWPAQDKFPSYQDIQEILQQAKADKVARKELLDTYYDDGRIAELIRR